MMKRLVVSALAALTAFAAQAATLVPVQLLSPAGSSAGQAIVSNGPSTPPSFQSVTFGILPQMAANTVLGNKTGSTAAPAAIAMPSCSTANSALQYTSGTGFSCGAAFALTSGNLSQFASTTSAQLATLLSDETGSGAAVFGTSPTITTPNIVGVTDGSSAAAGRVGEVISSNVPNGSAVALTSATVANVTSISLTAGDWDVWGVVGFKAAGTTTIAAVAGGINTVSASLPADGGSGSVITLTLPFTTGNGPSVPVGMRQINVSTTTTVYLVAYSSFGTSTMGAYGFIGARRRR